MQNIEKIVEKIVEKEEKTNLIDGKKIASEIREEIKEFARILELSHGIKPGLAVILVGSRPDSATYVRMKKRAVQEVEFFSRDFQLDEKVEEEKLLELIDELNLDEKIHAILVQLPLPPHIEEKKILERIRVDKDVDGFSAENIGRLCLKGSKPDAIPCTPLGCLELLKRSKIRLKGLDCVVLGRSNIVGMPVASLLQQEDCTVTVVHSRTREESRLRLLKEADLVVSAIGKPEYIEKAHLKEGCVVIDVGINSISDESPKGYRLVGDCAKDCREVAFKCTPVPGGVGPMTIAMLLKNTLNLARLSAKLDPVD